MYTTKNYKDGPDKMVIGGTLEVLKSATVTGLRYDPIIAAMLVRVYGVDTYNELVAALADTTLGFVYALKDITLTGTLAIAHALEMDCQNFSLTDASLDANQYMAAQISGEDVIVKNTVFAISGNSDANALYSIDVGAAGSCIENCTFTMANAGSAGSVSVYYEGYAGHKLNENTLSNGVALTGGAVMDEIKDNAFAATKGFGLGECTINGIHYFEADPEKVAAIKAYLIEQGNTTQGGVLVVEGYFEV